MMQAKFVQGNLFKHVSVMSLTASVGLMAIFAVDLINMIYISWLKDEAATAAIGYAGAVVFFGIAFGIGVSIGISALVAQAVGAGDMVLARRRTTSGLVLGGIGGVVFAAVLFLFMPEIAALLGANGASFDKTVEYLNILLPSQPLLMIGMNGGAVLRSYGDARGSMMITVWGAVLLAILDPIFILWADMGLAGAAIAVCGSRFLMALYALWQIRRYCGGSFAPVTWAVLRADIGPLWAISLPAILTQMAPPLGQAFVTRMVAHSDAAVAGMAIVGRLTPVAFGVVFAMSGAIGPIVGQNMGAGRMDRVRRAFWDAVIFTAIVIAVMSVILYAARAPIADLFHAQGLTREMLYLFCGPLSALFFFNGLIFIANAVCNNLGASFWATIINWGRHTLGTVPFAWWLMQDYGPKGVLVGQSLGGVLFGVLSVWLALRVIAQRETGAKM